LQAGSPEAAAYEAVGGIKSPPGASFPADYIFSGSTLSGWHTFGSADWRAEDGEIIGKARPNSNGGWLVLDKSYQDVLFFGRSRAPAGSKTGILVRAAKTPDGGLKGVFVSLDPQDENSYLLTLASQGQEISRTKLRPVPRGSQRFAVPAPPGAQAPPANYFATPAPNSTTAFHTDDWNVIDIQMDANILR